MSPVLLWLSLERLSVLGALNHPELFWSPRRLVVLVNHTGRNKGILGPVDKEHRPAVVVERLHGTSLAKVKAIEDSVVDAHRLLQWPGNSNWQVIEVAGLVGDFIHDGIVPAVFNEGLDLVR